MTGYQRYAVYLAPKAGPLAGFAAGWLGWDPACGAKVAHPELPGLPRPLAEITETPRKYGFHGTLKPPFALAEGQTEGALRAALADLAARQAPVTLPGLALAPLGRFLALVVQGDAAPLNALAAEVVRGLDRFRAPLTEAEMARRRLSRLSPRQAELLARWGYPYVLDQFRFHMTLTGKLSARDLDATRRVLEPVLAPLLPRPFVVTDLCLFGEAAGGRFHLVERVPLEG